MTYRDGEKKWIIREMRKQRVETIQKKKLIVNREDRLLKKELEDEYSIKINGL